MDERKTAAFIMQQKQTQPHPKLRPASIHHQNHGPEVVRTMV